MAGRFTRLRAVPWLLLFEAARALHSHVTDTLPPRDRRRVSEILRSSHGNPMAVTPSQREELRAMAAKLDLRSVARDLVPHVVEDARRRARKR